MRHALAIPRLEARSTFPLSFAQERMWLLQRIDRESVAYNALAGLDLRGPLDVGALRLALARVVERHAILRTTFQPADEGALQVVQPAMSPDLPLIDVPIGVRPDAMVDDELRLAFDLAQGPLFRGQLLRTAPDRHLLVITLHHIIGDAWSCQVFFRELAGHYEAAVAGRPASLPRLPIQYGDFAVWQRERVSGARRAVELDFWTRTLEGAPFVNDLPFDHPRPPRGQGMGSRRPVPFEPAARAGLVELAQALETTPFVVLSSVFALMLSRYSQRDDVLMATPVANRLFPEVQDLIGYFANTLVLRARVDATATGRAFVGAHHRACMAALAHQELPFEQLVGALRVPREAARQPLTQVAFAIDYAGGGTLSFAGLKATPIEWDGGMTSFDLAMVLELGAGDPRGWIKYRTDLFDASTIDAMAGAYGRLLSGLVAGPDRSLGELVRLCEPRAAAEPSAFVPANDMWLPVRVEHWASRQPAHVAISDGHCNLTYAGLEARASRIAAALIARGAGPEVVVGVLLDDPLECIVAVVAIWKAGSAYLPLDPTLPDARLRVMVEDARPVMLLASSGLAGRVGWGEHGALTLDQAERASATDVTVQPAPGHPESLAYVVYTSGSTGRPKGVLITRRGVMHIVDCQERQFSPGPQDNVLQFASLGFDASVFELLLGLAHGATLHVARREALLPGGPLRDTLRSRGITHALLSPSVVATLEAETDLPLTCLIVGGEACSEALARRLAPRLRLFNAYGPTEITIYSTLAELTPDFERLTIGRAIDHMDAWVVDSRVRPAPVGASGEILTGGAGLARGYLGRPDLTADRFIPHAFAGRSGARIYRTGDIGRQLADGSIAYLGRRDHQVKLRGHRIELGEVEAVLSGAPGVAECVVLVRPGPSGEEALVAYVTLQAGQCADPSGLRRHVVRQLPLYMTPTAFILLPAFPRTTSGKPDRRALAEAPLPSAADVQPSTSTRRFEREVLDVWAGLFAGVEIGCDSNFFDIGGNSLLLLRAQEALERRLNHPLATVELFRHPTVTSLARYLAELETPAATAVDLPRARVSRPRWRDRRLRRSGDVTPDA